MANKEQVIFTEEQMRVSAFVSFLYNKLMMARHNRLKVIDMSIPNVGMSCVYNGKTFVVKILNESFQFEKIHDAIKGVCKVFKLKDTREITVETILLLLSRENDPMIFFVEENDKKVIPTTNMEIIDLNFESASMRGIKSLCGLMIQSLRLKKQKFNPKTGVATNVFVVKPDDQLGRKLYPSKAEIQSFGFMNLNSAAKCNLGGYIDNKALISEVIKEGQDEIDKLKEAWLLKKKKQLDKNQ